MTGQAQRTGDGGRRRGAWVEVVSAVLLSVAAVAIAWSSYQASRWTGEQAKGSLRGPVLVRAVLRWYQHPDRSPTARAMILGIGCVVLLGTLAWIATFRSASRSSRHLPAANALVGEGRRLRVAMGGAGLWSRRSSALATFDTDWYHL